MTLCAKAFQALRRISSCRGYNLLHGRSARDSSRVVKGAKVFYSDISFGRSASASAAPTSESSVI